MPRLSARGRRVADVDFRGMMMQLFYTLVLIFQLSSCNDVHVLNIVEMQMFMYRREIDDQRHSVRYAFNALELLMLMIK